MVALIEKAGVKALALAGDVRDEAWNAAMTARVVEAFGGLDILVVNAGHQQYREAVSEVSTEDFDATLKTNLYALHWLCKAAEPHLPPGASIITTASIQAYEPSDILLDYATTKAGIVAYTKALARQMIEKGVRVNAVAPGLVDTPLTADWTAAQALWRERSPMRRAAQPQARHTAVGVDVEAHVRDRRMRQDLVFIKMLFVHL